MYSVVDLERLAAQPTVKLPPIAPNDNCALEVPVPTGCDAQGLPQRVEHYEGEDDVKEDVCEQDEIDNNVDSEAHDEPHLGLNKVELCKMVREKNDRINEFVRRICAFKDQAKTRNRLQNNRIAALHRGLEEAKKENTELARELGTLKAEMLFVKNTPLAPETPAQAQAQIKNSTDYLARLLEHVDRQYVDLQAEKQRHNSEIATAKARESKSAENMRLARAALDGLLQAPDTESTAPGAALLATLQSGNSAPSPSPVVQSSFCGTPNHHSGACSTSNAPHSAIAGGTILVPFVAMMSQHLDNPRWSNAFQSTAMMAFYKHKTFEQLRLEDYEQGRRYGRSCVTLKNEGAADR